MRLPLLLASAICVSPPSPSRSCVTLRRFSIRQVVRPVLATAPLRARMASSFPCADMTLSSITKRCCTIFPAVVSIGPNPVAA